MKSLFSRLLQTVSAGAEAMLVSVIAGSGSTPRGAGAKMAVFADGSIAGTIGGGALEYQCQQMALEALAQHKTYTWEFRLHPNQVADLGMVCGGDVEVCFQYLCADRQTIEQLQQILQALQRNADSWMVTTVSSPDSWAAQTAVVGRRELSAMGFPAPLTNKTCLLEIDGQRCYAEPLQTAGYVYLFGGGHISRALVPVLYPLGFRCIVLDDKMEFCQQERFPQAERTIQTAFTDFGSDITVQAGDYVVIMTRGHANDYHVLTQALRTEACYIGMIGSRSKQASIRARLAQDGFPADAFDRVHSPIGLPIQAVTPEEIAISIAAELVLHRAMQS